MTQIKQQVLSFDDWINEQGLNFRPEQYDLYRSLYEAGQQSRQAEIDALQKRIDEALEYVGTDFTDHYQGETCKEIYDILKGNQDEK